MTTRGAFDPDANADLSGRSFGTHQITAKIGAGGMGEVYAAHDTKLDRPVAFKLLPAQLAGDPDRLLQFSCLGKPGGGIVQVSYQVAAWSALLFGDLQFYRQENPGYAKR